MGKQDQSTEALASLSDEQLARLCAEGIEAAERTLMQRHMQAIYWLPRRAFGAPEEELSGFLLYALEKIRQRDILAKFDPERGARFATWFGVVIRRLYLDYLRAGAGEPHAVPLEEDALSAPAEPAPDADDGLLARLQVQCRVLFKLLL